MADIINTSSGYQTGSIDTATTLVNNVSPTDAKHINGPAGAIVQIETILGSGTTLKGSAADLATRLSIAVEANGKLKDFSSATKTTFPTTVAEAGTGTTSFTDGAVLLGNGTGALQALALPSSLKVLSHSGTAGTDPSWITGLLFQGPTSCAAGSSNSHSGALTVSANGNYSGIYYCTDFVLNVAITMTVQAAKYRLIIVASNSITINGTISAVGAGQAGSVGEVTTGISTAGSPGTDQPGGSGGCGSDGTISGRGGNVLSHGCVLGLGGAGVGTSSAGTAATQLTGALVPFHWLGAVGGAGGSGNAETTGVGAATGGAGGGSIVLIAPTIILASTSTLDTSASAGGNGSGTAGAGGGGAGNVYIACKSYTDNGCTFTMTKGAGGTGSLAGGAGADGVKQILIWA